MTDTHDRTLADPTLADADHGGLAALAAAASAHPLRAPVDRFLFLRHGRTMGNIARVFQHPDDPLAPEGFADADRAASILADGPFAHIAASDMARAWLTAGRVGAASGRPVSAVPAMRERYFGRWIGTPSHALDWRADPPDGETLAQFVERVAGGFEAVLTDPRPVLVVAHGGVLRVLAGMLAVDLPLDLTANALPLAVVRTASGWTITPHRGTPHRD
jgi:broad specificity phosphatase PhoE